MTRSTWVDGLRRAAIPFLLAAGTVGFGVLVNKHQRVADWLFLRYAGYCLLSILFAAACFSSGHLVVRRALGGRVLPLHEHAAVSFAAGVYVFFLGMFLGGLLGLYGNAFFSALPLALLVAGGGPGYRYLRRAYRHIAAARRKAPPPSRLSLLVHGFGVLGLALVYFAILTPNNAAFDSRWQHLGLAEHYVAVGAVRKFPEGSFIGAAPHLASFLYTWAFLMPKSVLFDRIELAAHLEFTVFLVALVGIPALFRRLVRPASVGPNAYRWAWVSRFLFPGIFLYDSSLCLGADHIASVFAVPIYLLLVRAWKELAPRYCALLALALTGAMLTKYTGALLLVAPALIAVPLRALWLLGRTVLRRGGPLPPRAWWAGPAAAFVAGVVLFSPHWLKNAIWYGDPLYPVLHKTFKHHHPWTADTAARFDIGFMNQLWRPERNLKGVQQTLTALLTFSFKPNDWERFHGSTPVFGSLFTLSLGLLPFLKGTRRLWGLFVATEIGVFAWYWTHHQDRYLQAALPWMAAATAAVLALAWRQGIAARVGVGAALALQIVWGADVYFMPGHAYIGVPAKASIDLLTRTPGRASADRLTFTDPFVGLGRVVPKNATLLVHDYHPHLGVGVPTVADCPYHQGGISYLRTPTARQVYDQLKSYGVTHLVWRNVAPREPDTLAGEIVFLDFIQHYGGTAKSVEGFMLSTMPAAAPPPGNPPDPVMVYSCGKGLRAGLYHLADLAIPALEKSREPRPYAPLNGDPVAMAKDAKAIVHDLACTTMPKGLEAGFVRTGQRDPWAVWIRR
ncbi:Hypothetical protein A7982_02278 [Minicystis rosea]|nr:Hypothetical protein A7982_02278 [Minicystis rosea]